MPEEPNTNPCAIGGKEALYSSSRILRELSDASEFSEIDDLVKKTADQLQSDQPRFMESKEIGDQISEAIARAQIYGGDPDVYIQILRTADLDNPEVMATFSNLMLRQQVTFHGMSAAKNRQVSLAKQISDGVDNGMDEVKIKDLEMQLTDANAQFRNYMTYNSVLGTGASRLLSQRKSKNIGKAFDLLTTKLGDKYKSSLDGEAFLKENRLNSETRAKLEAENAQVKEDIDTDIDTLSDEDLQSRITKDEETIKNQTKKINELQKDLDARTKEISELETKPEVDPRTDALNKQIKDLKADLKIQQTLQQLRKDIKGLRKKGKITNFQKEQLLDKLRSQSERLNQRLKVSDVKTKKLYDKFVNQNLGSQKARTFAKRLYLAAQDGREDAVLSMAAKLTERSGWTKFLDAGLQWFMGNILSGPPSYVLNGIAPVLTRGLLKLERATGALLTGNTDLLKAHMTMDSMFESTRQALEMGGKAFKSDTETLLGGARAMDPEISGESLGAFHSSNFKSKFMSSDPMVAIMNTVNVATRLPFRINGSVDVINKTFAVDNYLRTHYKMEGLSKIRKGDLDADGLGAYVDDKVRKMYNEDGSLYSEERMMKAYAKRALDEGFDETDPNAIARKHAEFMSEKIKEIQKNGGDLSEMDLLARRAEDFARESTFTGEPGAITNILNQLRDHVPLTKFLIPFVNTPMQILKFGWQRTLPGVFLSDIAPRLVKGTKQARLDFAKLGPIEQAAYRGRLTTAVASTGALIYFASNNRESITGGGPRNKDERRALEATGWQPYSFVKTDEEGNKTYYSYQRMDPFATMIGIIADIAEFGEMNPRSDQDLSTAAAGMAFTIAESLTDKSFLRGLNNVLNITGDPETYIPKTLKDIGAGMVVPMFVDKLKNYDSEILIKENRTIVDAILRKLPIAEENVPPKRTFLGEPVYKQNPFGLLGIANPVYISSQRNDIVDQKIQEMLPRFSLPPANYLNHGDTDMREFYNEGGRQAYDRFLELTSTTTIQGRNLRTALKGLFKSRAFKSAELNYLAAQQTGEPGVEDPRVELTKNIISRYRRLAKREVITEFPELQETVFNLKTQKRRMLNNPIPTL